MMVGRTSIAQRALRPTTSGRVDRSRSLRRFRPLLDAAAFSFVSSVTVRPAQDVQQPERPREGSSSRSNLGRPSGRPFRFRTRSTGSRVSASDANL